MINELAQRELEKKSIVELKALAYDMIAQRDLASAVLIEVNREIEKRFTKQSENQSTVLEKDVESVSS